MKIELKKISFNERMSDETNCFIADLYIDGKKVGYAQNEGRGGPTDYRGDTKADNVLIAKAEKYCKTLPKVKYHDMEWEQSLEGVIDDLLTEYLVAKEAKKKLKMYEKAICYGIPNAPSYRTVYWKGRVLKGVPLPYLQKAYDDVKAKLGKNEVILNTNLVALGINL